MVTIEQLRTLQAIVEHGGFRAAGEALFKSQSAISIAIQKLETELGVSLFQRNQYRPKLTKQGKALYQKAISILSHTQELSNMAKHLSAGEEPELRLAVSSIVPIQAMLMPLHHIMQQAPATKFSLLIETLNGTMERLNDDDADIILIEGFEPDNDYEHILLGHIEMVTILAPSSPLAAKENLSLAELEGSTQIIVRDTSRHSEKQSAGVVHEARHWVVNDFMTKKQIISSGIGWGRVPRHMVEREIASGELLVLSDTALAPIQVNISAVYKRNKPLGFIAQQLWQSLQDIDWHPPH